MNLTNENQVFLAREAAAIEMAYKLNKTLSGQGKITLISEGYEVIKERFDLFNKLNESFSH